MDSKEQTCPFCHDVFSIAEIKDHIVIAHFHLKSGNSNFANKEEKDQSDSQFQCEECFTEFVSELSLERHLKFSHEKSDSNELGKSKFLDNVLEPRVILNVKKHSCSECHKSYTQSHNLKSHVKKKHSIGKPKSGPGSFPEPTTKAVVDKTKSTLAAYLDPKVILIKLSVCQECSLTFKTKSDLKLHLKTIHKYPAETDNQKLGIELLHCQECTKTFRSKLGLETHVKTIHRGIRVECSKCTKTFTNASGLRYHMKTFHSQSGFTQKQGRPKATHDGGKRLKCRECDRTFAFQSNRAQHVFAFHRGKRRQCPKCDKSYTQHNNLLKHVRTIHGGIKK